jgi:hypothetical protein
MIGGKRIMLFLDSMTNMSRCHHDIMGILILNKLWVHIVTCINLISYSKTQITRTKHD